MERKYRRREEEFRRESRDRKVRRSDGSRSSPRSRRDFDIRHKRRRSKSFSRSPYCRRSMSSSQHRGQLTSYHGKPEKVQEKRETSRSLERRNDQRKTLSSSSIVSPCVKKKLIVGCEKQSGVLSDKDSSSTSDSTRERRKLKKAKKKAKKIKSSHSKKTKKRRHNERKDQSGTMEEKVKFKTHRSEPSDTLIEVSQAVPLELKSNGVGDVKLEEFRKLMKPMTHDEYLKQQSVIRKVYDPLSGRDRLIRGDGEIIEEIVSKSNQNAINKSATVQDGLCFQAKLKRSK